VNNSQPLKLVSDLTDHEIAAAAKERKKRERELGLTKTNGAAPAEILPPEGPHTYDDLSNAERFLAIYGQDLLYLTEAKKWLFWNGKYWETDKTNFVDELSCDFVKQLYSPENARDADSFKHAKRSNNASGLEAMIKIARKKKAISIEQLDAQVYLLNCANGTVDLKTGEIRPHDRADFLTRIVNGDYDPDAESPNYLNFLRTIQPDPAIRSFLQRSIGYSLLGVVRERSFWILYGTGNNGKSVFTNLFTNLLGEYASTTTAATVMQNKGNGIPNDIARLRGKRFVVIPETEENERLNAALIKALSAGDRVSARFLFGEWFDFLFSGKMWIATNHKPTIADHSKGFWDRLKLIPFTTDIPADKVIKQDDLLASMMSEASGIINWAIQGCRDYFEIDGLDVPKVIQSEIDAYKREQDSIAQFIEEACETIEQAKATDPEAYIIPAHYRVKNGDLYKAYKKFCDDNGEFLRSQRRLSQNMKERGFKQTNSGSTGGRYWEGIQLLDASDK
jgi:putative DNA primase/helicase